MRGGVQTVASQIAYGMKNKNYIVHVLTNKYPRFLKKEEVISGIKVSRYPHPVDRIFVNSGFKHFVFSMWSQLFFNHSLRLIDQRVNELNPDVINVHFPTHQLRYLRKLTSNNKAKIVLSFHGHEVTRWFQEKDGVVTNVLRKLISDEKIVLNELKLAVNNCDSFTTCSSWLLAKIHMLIPSSIGKGFVIHNGVEVSRFKECDNPKIINNQIFSFGRLEYDKGFDLLICAFKEMLIHKPGLSLVIAGSGSEHSRLKRMIEDLSLTEYVFIIKWQKPNKILELLNTSSIVVVPSRRESFGITVLEGLSSLKPVVATTVGGIPEILQNYGILVSPTVNGIVEGLKSAFNFTMNEKEIRNHLKEFELSKMLKKYESIFVT